jgi:hypothetical protein
VSTLEVPGGDAAKLLELADQLDSAASGTTGLSSSTRQAMSSTPSWTGDAADAAEALGDDLTDGVAGVLPPLQRISTAIRSYADTLSTAQEKVNSYNLSVADESMTGTSESDVLIPMQAAAQDAQSALDALDTAGDRAASEIQAATAELQGVFQTDGPVRDYLASLPAGMDPYSTAPEPGEPGWIGITDPPGDLGPGIFGDPPGDLGPGIFGDPPGDLGPGIFADPPGDLGPGVTVDPPGLLGPLINYDEQPPEDGGGDDGQDEGGEDDGGGYTPTPGTPADDFTNDELAWLAYGHSGGEDDPEKPTVTEIEQALQNGTATPISGQDSVQVDYGEVRVIINEADPVRSTAYYPGSLGPPDE